jgi:hypothetical protein
LIILILVALLSGARNEKNSHLSQQVFDRMKKRFPEVGNSLPAALVLLANTYASSGDMEKASNIQIQLSRSSVKKTIGLSWTVVNGQYFVSLLLIYKKNRIILFSLRSNFELMVLLILDLRKSMM